MSDLKTLGQRDINESLNEIEQAELHRHESVIQRGKQAFIEVGTALMSIRDGRLYKGEYDTFEEYCQSKWGFSRNFAHMQIQSAGIAGELLTTVNIPNENTAREFISVPAEDRPVIAEQAKAIAATHGRDTINSRDVKEAKSGFNQSKNQPDPVLSVLTDGHTVAGDSSFFSLDRLSGQRIGFDDWYLVDTWKQVEDKIDLFINEGTSKGRFNEQDGDSIEWARWSWNPVTGCEHGCPYCYARDIANRFYDQKFTPSIWPNRINIPRSMKVPESAQLDVSYKNVFTCSMADLFGRWVPVKWIELVMESARKSPQWNFLFLTKFPQRIHELGELPQNAWMGTSVDCQSRVKNAEKAFEKIGGGTKWLSIEPMLTPLKFSRLDLFDWVVIGGASESAQTPKWIPPMDWLVDLHKQARDAGCKIYYKSNLFLPDDLRIKEFPWVQSVERLLPEHLKYVGIK